MLRIHGIFIWYEYMVRGYTGYEYVVNVYRTWILGINIRDDVYTRHRYTWYESVVCVYMIWVHGICTSGIDVLHAERYEYSMVLKKQWGILSKIESHESSYHTYNLLTR